MFFNLNFIFLPKLTKFFDSVHKRPLDLQTRSKYHDLVHNCLNTESQELYGLKLKTYIEYCEQRGKTSERGKLNKIYTNSINFLIFQMCRIELLIKCWRFF